MFFSCLATLTEIFDRFRLKSNFIFKTEKRAKPVPIDNCKYFDYLFSISSIFLSISFALSLSGFNSKDF